MVDLKLDFDEGIILQGSYCGRYGTSEIELDEIYLTNKNLICIYEKSNGMFSKSETITENIPLESIKVINGNVQVMEIDNDEYGLGLQILFKNGTRELFVFDNPKKELPKWKNAIVATINGEPIPTEEKPSKKEKVAAFAGATAFASKIKSAVDSTKQTFSDISQQVKETATSAFDTEKPEVAEEKAEPISDEVKYIYCSNCGEKLISTSKFCQSCGAKVGTVIVEQKTSQEDVEENPVVSSKEPIEPKADDEPVIKVTQEEYTERKTVYEGKIHKCPNCGEVLNAFTSNCPSCGYELRGTFGNSSVRELATKLEAIESKRENVKSNAIKSLYFGKAMTKTDEQKISLIRSFPIPNTKEDLYEFLVLSQSNIDIALYEEGNQFKINSARGALSEAWKAKFEQAYQKAKLVFANDPRMSEIQRLYESTQKTVRRAKTKTWRLVGIIYGILFGVIGITLILVFTLTANSEKKEIKRLENIVVEIEAALDDGDYKFALMNADRLDFTGSDAELNRDWEIKREYWIDKVIEEAAEKGVVLERPKEKEEPAESNANNSTESTNKENNTTTVTESGSFDEKAVIKQLKVTEHRRNEYEHYFPILIIENPTEYNLSLSVDVKFYNKSGELVGAESDEVYAFEKGTKTIMQFSVDEEFERMEYEFSVKEENYYNCVISSLKYESTSAKDKEILSVTNSGSIPAEFVEGYALFFKDGKLVGTDWTYFTDDDSELKPGKTITEELTSYGDEYDSVEFYFTGRGEKE